MGRPETGGLFVYDQTHMSDSEKKQFERAIIEKARQRSGLFPKGELSEHESPDWLIRDSSLGIEVSQILRPGSRDTFSGAEVFAYQRQVIELAKGHYMSFNSASADLLVWFDNEWHVRKDARRLARDISEFVRQNYPSDSDSITFRKGRVQPWIEGLSRIRISRSGTRWQAGGSAGIYTLREDDLRTCIEAKNNLLPRYRERLPGWGIWLLLATDIRVLKTAEIPHDVEGWRFAFGFDKVLLLSWDGRLIELAHT